MYMTTNCDEDSKRNHMVTWRKFWRLVNIDLRVKGWQWGRKFNIKQSMNPDRQDKESLTEWLNIHTHTQSRYNNLIQKNHSCHYLKDESMWMDMYWGEESVERFMRCSGMCCNIRGTQLWSIRLSLAINCFRRVIVWVIIWV